MATVQESIEVNVPLRQAYNQWTQFEDFPHFMSGVDSVTQLDDTTVHFKTSIGGVKREYDARITAQEPDQRSRGRASTNHATPALSGSRPSAPAKRRSTSSSPGSRTRRRRRLGAAMGLDSRQVASDLKKFKQFIEERDADTGAWRGTRGRRRARGRRRRGGRRWRRWWWGWRRRQF